MGGRGCMLANMLWSGVLIEFWCTGPFALGFWGPVAERMDRWEEGVVLEPFWNPLGQQARMPRHMSMDGQLLCVVTKPPTTLLQVATDVRAEHISAN